MNISEKGLNLIKEFEGCYLEAYKCPSHVWTIGWGHTGDVYEGQKITQEEADNLLKSDMVEYENYVNNCSELTFKPNQSQFDALVSFTYNCGLGALNTLVKNRDVNTVADKMLLYVNGSDGVLPGLVRRRKAERELFLQNYGKEKNNLIAQLQKECNAQGFSNQVVDGIAGPNTLAGCPLVKEGARGNITKILQQILGASPDGIFGPDTKAAVVEFQKAHGLDADGIVGKKTWRKLLKI